MCFQHRGVEYRDQAGHLWEPGFSPQCRTLPHRAVLQHERQHLCFCWEVSQCVCAAMFISLIVQRVFSPRCSVSGQRDAAGLGAGPAQQEDPAHRVSDRQAEEDREMYRGTTPSDFCKVTLLEAQLRL